MPHTVQPNERTTIDKVDQNKPLHEWKPLLADLRCRRHLCLSFDFDFRAGFMQEPDVEAPDEIKREFKEFLEKMKMKLACEFGSDYLERKIDDFVAIGTRPTSIISYHNQYFYQTRSAFVCGLYYPALVSACALG